MIEGPKTLIGFHRALLSHQCFVDGETCFGLVESELLARQAEELEPARPPATANGRVDTRVSLVELDGRRYEVRVLVPEPQYKELVRRRRERGHGGHGGHARDAVTSPMQGTVLAVEVADGDEVEAGQVICIVEAMKMENEISAHRDGVVSELSLAPGQAVSAGQVICVVTQDGVDCVGRSARRSRPASASRSARRQVASTTGSCSSTAASGAPEPLQGSMLDPSVKAHLVEQLSRPALEAALHPPAAPGAARRRVLYGYDRRGGADPSPSRPRRARGAGRPRPLRSRPRAEGGRSRCSPFARTASATRVARSSAARCTTRCGTSPDPEWVWQCTHVGGDRFAGNLVCFSRRPVLRASWAR